MAIGFSMTGFLRLSALTVVLLLGACQSLTSSPRAASSLPEGPSCKGFRAPAAQVTAALGHAGLVAGACFWCGLSDNERRHFTEEEAKAIREATPGKTVRILSPERGEQVFMLLDIESVGTEGPNKRCVTYTETVHWEGKEAKYPKRACEFFKEKAGAAPQAHGEK